MNANSTLGLSDSHCFLHLIESNVVTIIDRFLPVLLKILTVINNKFFKNLPFVKI